MTMKAKRLQPGDLFENCAVIIEIDRMSEEGTTNARTLYVDGNTNDWAWGNANEVDAVRPGVNGHEITRLPPMLVVRYHAERFLDDPTIETLVDLQEALDFARLTL